MSRGETSRSPELVEVLKALLDKASCDMYVARPGKIVSYNPATQTAEVLLLINNSWVDSEGGTGVDVLPTLTMVPVLFPGGGGYFMSFPLRSGDIGLVVFCDRSIDNYWFADGSTPMDPVDLRSHDLSDAVFIPLKFGPQARAIKGEIASSAVFGKELGFQVRAGEAGIDVTTAGSPTATGYVAMSTKIDSIILALEIMLDAFVPVPGDGGAALAKALSAALKGFSAGYTASTNLKAD